MVATLRRLHPDAWLERLLVLVLAASGFGLALALLGMFKPWVVGVLALLTTVVYHRRTACVPATGPVLRGWQVLALLLLALAFRIPPFQYVLGGQDQGVYTNVAAHLLHTGGVQVHDQEYTRLDREGGLAEYYRQNYTYPFLPGVYTSKVPGPEQYFQFYHLFPVWLALAGSVAGVGWSGFGLVFLSLVSVLFFQRLAGQLSGSARVGLAAGLMLAANPLHAFFSKFPVTEVPMLAFSSAGFCFLAMYATAPAASRPARWLWLSALALGCAFFTRMSGFMYLPIIAAIPVVTLSCDPDRDRARALSLWSLAVLVAYVLSVLYGLAWSPDYVLRNYYDSFAPLLGPDWRNALLVIGVALTAFGASLWIGREGEFAARVGAALRQLDRWMGPVLLLVLVAGAYKVWQLGFTDRYRGNEVLGQFPGVVGAGWESVAHSSLLVTSLYLGPLAFLALVPLSFARLPAPGRLLLFFVCGFLAYAALLNWVVPYQPYYARYLLSELVPYALLLLCCSLAWLDGRTARRWLGGALAISAAGYLALSGAQLGKQDNEGAYDSIGELAAIVGDQDVILLDGLPGQGFWPKEVKTTLVYTFGRHVLTIGGSSLADMDFMSAVDRAYDRVFVVSTRGGLPPGYSELETVRIWARGFERTNLPPYRLVPTMDARLRVFRLDHLEFSPGHRRRFQLDHDPRVQSPVGEQRRGTGVLALGRAGQLLAGPGIDLPAGRFRFTLLGRADGHEDARVDLVERETGKALASVAVATRATPAGAIAWLDFVVPPGGVRKLDVRVWVGPGSRLLLQNYDIVRMP